MFFKSIFSKYMLWVIMFIFFLQILQWLVFIDLDLLYLNFLIFIDLFNCESFHKCEHTVTFYDFLWHTLQWHLFCYTIFNDISNQNIWSTLNSMEWAANAKSINSMIHTDDTKEKHHAHKHQKMYFCSKSLFGGEWTGL